MRDLAIADLHYSSSLRTSRILEMLKFLGRVVGVLVLVGLGAGIVRDVFSEATFWGATLLSCAIIAIGFILWHDPWSRPSLISFFGKSARLSQAIAYSLSILPWIWLIWSLLHVDGEINNSGIVFLAVICACLLLPIIAFVATFDESKLRLLHAMGVDSSQEGLKPMADQTTSGSGSPIVSGSGNSVSVTVNPKNETDEHVNRLIFDNAYRQQVLGTASSMSITLSTHPMDRNSFGFSLPTVESKRLIANLPDSVPREEVILSQVKGIREGISKALANFRKSSDVPFDKIVNEELVQSWHDRLNDIEQNFNKKS